MSGRYAIAALIAVCAAPVAALPLALPQGAEVAAETVEAGQDVPFPTGPFDRFDPTVDRAAGEVARTVWRVSPSVLTTLQLLEPLRDQIRALGYEVVFECADIACGGFDFRFALDLIGEPVMHVDLGDYRYLAATRGDDALTLVVSRSDTTGFVHLTAVGGDPVTTAPSGVVGSPTVPSTPDGLVEALEATGRTVLDGLVFATGSAELDAQPFEALAALADYLKADPSRVVTLVGHTDAMGSLAANVALSRNRATAVLNRLVTRHEVAPGQLRAEGVGFLMPLARNDTDAGRRLNRRVEAVLLPAQ